MRKWWRNKKRRKWVCWKCGEMRKRIWEWAERTKNELLTDCNHPNALIAPDTYDLYDFYGTITGLNRIKLLREFRWCTELPYMYLSTQSRPRNSVLLTSHLYQSSYAFWNVVALHLSAECWQVERLDLPSLDGPAPSGSMDYTYFWPYRLHLLLDQ